MGLDIIRNRLSLANALLRKKELYCAAPQEVIIEITKRCNLRCPMCVRTYLGDVEPKDISLREFCLLLGNITGKTELITLAGLGEPLLNPEAVNMVYECNKRRFKTALYTNATLLNEKLSSGLLKAGLSGIVISFDGATEKTYEYYRKGASFNEVKRNILDFLEIKKALKSQIFVEIQMIVFQDNSSEIKQFLNTWSIPGIDSVRIKNDQMCVKDDDSPSRKQSYAINRKRFCSMPWRGPATVNVYGDVYPCCVGSKHNVVIGNMFNSAMEDLWNSNPANKLRKDFVASGKKLPNCKGCNIPLLPLSLCGFGALLSPLLIYKAYAKVERLFDVRAAEQSK